MTTNPLPSVEVSVGSVNGPVSDVAYAALENQQVELSSLDVGKALAGALEALPLVLGDGFASCLLYTSDAADE